MKRILFLLLLLTIFISACSNSEGDTIPTDTPLPEGSIKIPDVIGMTRDEAYDALEKLGLIPKTFWVIHDEYQYGVVADVEPGVGEIVQVDSEIILDVVGEVINNGPGIAGDGSDDGQDEKIQIQIIEICGSMPSMINCTAEYKNWCICTGGWHKCYESHQQCFYD